MIDAGGRPSVNWQFLAYIILTLGETMVSITGPRVFLHPGAEQDEERGHGALALYRLDGQPLHRGG